MGFKLFAEKKAAKKEDEEAQGQEEEEDAPQGAVSLSQGYDYLLSMKIWSLTMERVKALTAERDEKRRELDILSGKTAEDIWLEDLDALEVALKDFEVRTYVRMCMLKKAEITSSTLDCIALFSSLFLLSDSSD